MESLTQAQIDEQIAQLTAQKEQVERAEQQRKSELQDLLDALTETGNAEKFVEILDDRAKYIRQLKQWVYWDDERWQLDYDGYIARRFKQVIAYLKEHQNKFASMAAEEADEAAQKVLFNMVQEVDRWIKRSQNKQSIMNSISLATFEQGITLDYTEFDKKGHYFGVANGVVDLRSGELINGDPRYLMMKGSQVSYDTIAECSHWQQFLLDIMSGDEDKVAFLQQIAGSAMVGNTKEKMFVMQGGGSNGKSTFINVLNRVLGSVDDCGYKATIKPEVFTEKVSNPEYYLATLKGARAIMMSETSGRGILNDTLVKQVVDSEEGLQARIVRGEAFEFAVVGTVMMLTNNIPKVIATDNGVWRRLCLIKFDRTFSEEEKDRSLIKGKLEPELAGILNWCVQGAVQYFANGQKFVLPQVIVDDTKAWRDGEDKLGCFMSECMCETNGATKLTDMLNAYDDWCNKRNQHAGSEKELKKQLVARGIEVDNGSLGGTVRVVGWTLLNDDILLEEVLSDSPRDRKLKALFSR